ncbi:hypothetical protein BaRGS_00024529, partial [Batillaria attramentaria]
KARTGVWLAYPAMCRGRRLGNTHVTAAVLVQTGPVKLSGRSLKESCVFSGSSVKRHNLKRKTTTEQQRPVTVPKEGRKEN